MQKPTVTRQSFGAKPSIQVHSNFVRQHAEQDGSLYKARLPCKDADLIFNNPFFTKVVLQKEFVSMPPSQLELVSQQLRCLRNMEGGALRKTGQTHMPADNWAIGDPLFLEH